jgi:uncharacterized YigZ family protein
MNIGQLHGKTISELEFSIGAPLRVTTEVASVELVVKKSRFLGTAIPLPAPEYAEELVASVARRDATHNTWAWRVGERHQFSDDGEPGGTAGRPIFSVLEGSGLDLTLVVVTRWFGGITLGSGGLVRAYSQAAQQCLAAAPVRELVPRVRLALDLPYTMQSPVYRLLETFGATKTGETFSDAGVTLGLVLRREQQAAFQLELTNLSRGTLTLRDWTGAGETK